MALNKSIFYLLTILVAINLCSCYPEKYENEAPCVSAGGICLKEVKCPNKIEQDHLGLCPNQRKNGIECCHGITIREIKCQELGGECFDLSSNCRVDNITASATDCEEGTKCCMLI